MEILKLFWLGPPHIVLKGRAIKLETRKVAALLAYLSLNQGQCQRERLATMFWPENGQQKALSNLRRTLFSLNSSLPGWTEADHETITLKHTSGLWVDVDAFQQLLLQSQEHSHSEKAVCDGCLSILSKAVQHYRGDFLEGLNLSDSPGFDEWQIFQRDSLRQEFGEILQRLSLGYAERGRLDQAIASARQWVALDRLYEPACRTLMTLFSRSGKRTAALHQYEELARLLDEQLGQDPEPETRRLYESVRGRVQKKKIVEPSKPPASFPLLKTKLYIPTAPTSQVLRSRLIDCLGEAEQKVLTLISAPAGFGKSTLLAEWVAQSSLPVAWLSLDNGENDPYRFLSYLIAAFESLHEDVGTEARQMMQSPQPVSPLILLASLVSDLQKIPGPHVLVMDDYQFITEHSVHETMAYLLDHLPPRTHIVIATREDPPLQVGRLRAHGQLLELRTHDLRFSSEETTELLNGILGLALSQEHLKILEEKTEGWIVGLQMAALSLRNREGREAFINAFSGSNRYVMDYLLDEVLALQEAHVEHFLIVTSILDQLSGPLCDTVLDDDWSEGQHRSGQEMLEYLEGTNMFVVPLDDKRVWYRYHHLFADLLHTRQGKYSTDQISTFRIRASRWCAEQGFILEAIKYALDAGDSSRAAALIDGISKFFISPTDFVELQGYISRIPAEIIRKHLWTCLAQTHIWVTLGKVDKVDEWLDWIEANLQAKQQDSGDDQNNEVSGTIALHRAYVRLFNGDLSNAARLGSTALQKLQLSQVHLRCRLALLVGESYLLQGVFEKSNTYLREAIDLSKTISDMFLFTTACYRLTLQLKLQGKLTEAENIYKENIRLLQASEWESSPLMAKPLVGLGDIYRERGQFGDAEYLLTTGTQKAEQLGHSQDLVYAYSLIAKFMQARGNFERAIEYLDKNIELFQISPVPEAIVQVTRNLRAWIHLLHHKPDNSGKRISLPSIDLNTKINFLNELDFTMYARSLILSHDYPLAMDLLTQAANIAEKEGRVERLIKVLILQAIALYDSGEEEKAIATLMRSLVLAEPEGYQRIFLDEGEPLLRLLKRLDTSKTAPQLQNFVGHLLEASLASAQASS